MTPTYYKHYKDNLAVYFNFLSCATSLFIVSSVTMILYIILATDFIFLFLTFYKHILYNTQKDLHTIWPVHTNL